MKKNILLNLFTSAIICLNLFSCKSEPKDFQIKGKLSNSSGETVSLLDMNSQNIIDSVKVNGEGEFFITKKVPEKGFYILQTSPSNFAALILDSAEKISFEADAKNIGESCSVENSPDSKLFLDFSNETKKKYKEMERIGFKQDSIHRTFEAYMNTTKDTAQIDSLSKTLEPVFDNFSLQFRKVADETASYIKKFVDVHKDNFAALAAVQKLNPNKDIEYYSRVADALTQKYPSIKNLQGFKEYIDKQKKLTVGVPAPEIAMNDKDGKLLKLSSLKGKIVIVDFWASWCKPCRAENPFVVSLYEKYKNKGLEIFSVSLDFSKDAWLRAIEQDKLVWKNHVTDLKQWQSPIVSLYGFEEIPFTVVVDKNGIIAGKNLQEPELEAKVKELLTSP